MAPKNTTLESRPLQIIGIDCATQDHKTGVARGRVVGGKLTIEELKLCSEDRSARHTVGGWLRENTDKTLLAIDAPLGWPIGMRSVTTHVAGSGPSQSAESMFRRKTDIFVTKSVGQRPLDVGADRIARTAHAALTLLAYLREDSGELIPLAWEQAFATRVAAIEVYPAATLKVNGFVSKGYKKRDQAGERSKIVAQLAGCCTISNSKLLHTEADVLDAAVCVVAGHEFLEGKTYLPDDIETAQQEGWIWVTKKRSQF